MIDVQFAAAPCSASEPSLSASPTGTVSTSAGTPVTFSVSVRNLDDASCGSSSFNLEGWVPSGWSWAASPASVSVPAGGSASASVTVTPSSTSSGASDIQIGAYRSSGPGASIVRTVDVSAAPGAPTAALAINLSVLEDRRGLTFMAAVTADGQPISGATVEMTLVDPTGSTVRTFSMTTDAGGIATANFKPRRKDPAGTYTLEGAASAGGSSASATVRFVVN